MNQSDERKPYTTEQLLESACRHLDYHAFFLKKIAFWLWVIAMMLGGLICLSLLGLLMSR